MPPLPVVMSETRLRSIWAERQQNRQTKACLVCSSVSGETGCVGIECVWVCSKRALTLNCTSLAINTAFSMSPIWADFLWLSGSSAVSFVSPHPSIHTDWRDPGYIMKSHSVKCALLSQLVCRNGAGEKQGNTELWKQQTLIPGAL